MISALESNENLVYEEDIHECSEERKERTSNANTKAEEIVSIGLIIHL